MTTRRRFLGRLAAIVAGVILVPLSRAWGKKIAVPLAKAEKLRSAGGSAILKIKDRSMLFIRPTADDVRVLDPTCTHKKCMVQYNPASGHIECPCHSSTFDLEGKVLKGPAEKPLKTFTAALSGDRIVVTLD